MGLKLVSEHLNGLKVFVPAVFEDSRGFFMESFKASEFEALGLPAVFVQDNHSRSCKGVVRGMHFQWDKPQGKLIRVTVGAAFVAEIDIRKNSPTAAQWFGIELSAANKKVLWVPPGFANGFCATSDWMEMQYKCTAEWNKHGESNILWNDPRVAIDWPVSEALLSDKDAQAQTFDEWMRAKESEAFTF